MSTGKRSTSEARIKLHIIERLRAEWPTGQWRVRHIGPNEVAGDADVYGCEPVEGRHVEIEVKRPGREATKIQKHRLERWRQARAITGVAHDSDEAVEIVLLGGACRPSR